MHCFCEATDHAYAAAIYGVMQNEDQISVKLLIAKATVAPIKSLPLLRLELCGAVILAKLAAYVLNKFDRPSLLIFGQIQKSLLLGFKHTHLSGKLLCLIE